MFFYIRRETAPVPPHQFPITKIKKTWISMPNSRREVNFFRFQEDYHGRESGFDFTSYVTKDLTTLIRSK